MASTFPKQQADVARSRRAPRTSTREAATSESASTSSRSPLHSLTGIQIASTGSFAPEKRVRNEDLAELGYDADWIIQRTGITERRRTVEGQATSDLVYEASERCLSEANVSGADLDLILVATMTPDMRTPSTACLVQERLGAKCAAMDLNAACAGFMYALVTGAQFVNSGNANRVLVVGADAMSGTVNPNDKKTFPLFGDGAGAALLTTGGEGQGLLAYTLGAEGGGADLLCMPAGGSREPLTPEAMEAGRQFLHMEGRSVFKWAVRLVADSILDVLKSAQLSPGDIDLLVLHQANMRIIDAAVEDLGIDRDKIMVNLDRYGNTSAGSIPLALDEARQQNRVKPGDHVLMCGFGAGLAWGTALFKW